MNKGSLWTRTENQPMLCIEVCAIKRCLVFFYMLLYEYKDDEGPNQQDERITTVKSIFDFIGF